MTEPRRPWYLLTGLVIGLAMGLLTAWVLAPVAYADTAPASLRADFQDGFRELIAGAFVATGDLGRAQARLALLGDPDPARTLAMQAQRMLAEGGPTGTARSLGLLAAAIESGGAIPLIETSLASSTETATPEGVVTPTVTATLSGTATPAESGAVSATPDGNPTERPTRTATPTPSHTPTPTQGAPFALQDYVLVCDPGLNPPRIQVYVTDAGGNPVPGVGLQVRWEGGQEVFYTGLKPEFGLGYADYEMSEGGVYSLTLAEGGELVNGLAPSGDCPATSNGSTYPGSWRVNFRQP